MVDRLICIVYDYTIPITICNRMFWIFVVNSVELLTYFSDLIHFRILLRWFPLFSFLEDVLYSDTMLHYLVRCPWSSGLGRPQVDPVFILNTYRRQCHNQKLRLYLYTYIYWMTPNHTYIHFVTSIWWSNSYSSYESLLLLVIIGLLI